VKPDTESAEQEPPFPDPLEARRKAMNCLARREYGKAELVAKLLDSGFDAGTARAAVDRLAADGLQNDRRFAASLVQSRINQGKGPVRIRQDLAQRGIDAALVDEALADSGENWTELAGRVRHRKFGADLPPDFPEKARQMRFLQSRGFTAEQIQAAMERAAPNP
jgi:regulatory protein